MFVTFMVINFILEEISTPGWQGSTTRSTPSYPNSSSHQQQRAESISRLKDVASCFNKREQFVSVWWISGLPHTNKMVKYWLLFICDHFFRSGCSKTSFASVRDESLRQSSKRHDKVRWESGRLCTRKNLSWPQVLHFRQNYTITISVCSSQKAASSSCSCTVSQPRSACCLIFMASYSLRIISWSSGGRFWIRSTTAIQTI